LRLGLLAEPRFARLVGGMLLLTTVFFLVLSALPLDLVRGQGMSEAALGLLYALNAVIVVLFEIPLVTSLAHWPAPRVLAAGSVCIALGVGATAFAHDFATAVPTVVLWSLGEMLVFPAGSTYVSAITRGTRRGEAMGVYTSAFGAGFVLAPLLGTWVLGRWGADAMWLGALVVGLIAALVLLRLDGRRREGVPSVA
jgi:predicted MFS family arabinose efflux permease